MRRASSSFGLFCGMGLLAGCFDPSSSETSASGSDTETGSDSSSSDAPDSDPSGDPTGNDTTGDPTSDGSSSDDSTPGDDPPTIDAFTVDGSTEPSELQDSDRVRLLAEVSDDNGVARVEFYDGDVLIGTATEAPYEAAVLLTSSDNGSRDFSARAFDSVDQRADSDTITLSVNVEGGSQVAIAENLFESTVFVFYPSVGVALADDGDVIVTGAVTFADQQGVAVMAQRWNPELTEQRWATQTEDTLGEPVTFQFPYGQPAVDAEGFVLVGGIAEGTSITAGTPAIYRIGDEPFATPLQLPPEVAPETPTIPFGGLTRAPSGEVYFAGPNEHLTKLSADLGDEVWREPVIPIAGPDIAALRIITASDGSPVVDAFLCGETECSITVRKINAETGGIRWTRSTPFASTSIELLGIGGTAAGPDGRLATLVSRPLAQGGGVDITVRDADGDTISEGFLEADDANGYFITDLAYDAQGQLVVTGSVAIEGNTPEDPDYYQAWIARIAEDGTVLWDQRFAFDAAEPSYGFGGGIEIDDRGRIYMAGIRDSLSGGWFTIIGQPMLVQLNP